MVSPNLTLIHLAHDNGVNYKCSLLIHILPFQPA